MPEEEIETPEEEKPEETEKSYIKVLSPKGGEIWELGKTYTISWEHSGVDEIYISIVDYNASEQCLLNNEKPISAKTGKYTFKLDTCIAHPGMSQYIEVPISPGDKYKVLVYSEDKPDTIRDFSDNYFSIIFLRRNYRWFLQKNKEF